MSTKILPFLLITVFFTLAQSKVFATDYYWIGNGGNSNWNTAANWNTRPDGSGTSGVPANRVSTSILGDNVYFLAGNFPCDINTTVNVEKFEISAGYSGVIQQGNASLTVTDFIMTGGTLIGSANSARNITIRGNFTQTAGTFAASKGSFILSGSSTTHTFSGNFIHNSSLTEFRGTSTINGNPNFYNLQLTASGKRIFTINNTIQVLNNLTLADSGAIYINTGTINLANTANLVCQNAGLNGGGDGLITFTGSGNQNLAGAAYAAQCKLPRIKIDKTSGTVTFSNYVNLSNDFTNASSSVDAISANATVIFSNGSNGLTSGTITSYSIAGNTTFHKLEFAPTINTNFNIDANTTLTVNNSFTYSGDRRANFNAGKIDLKGDMIVTNTSNSGSTSTGTIRFTGPGNQQIIGSNTEGIGQLPNIEVSKPAGSTLTLNGFINLKGNWFFNSGTLNAGTSTVVINGSLAIEGIQHAFNDMIIPGSVQTKLTTNVVQGLQVNNLEIRGANNVTLSAASANVQSTLIKVAGNLTNSNTSISTSGGTASISFNGSGTQNFIGGNIIGAGTLPNITIDKPGGILNLMNTINLANGADWTLNSGTLNAGTSTVVVNSTGSITNFNGSQTLNNLIFNIANTTSQTYRLLNNTALTVAGNLTFDGPAGYAATLSNGTLDAKQDIAINNGSLNITIGGLTVSGTSNQSIISANPIGISSLTVNKPSGALLIGNDVNVGSNLTMTSGDIDMNGKTLTLGTGATTSTRGTLTYAAGKIMNGKFSRWYGSNNNVSLASNAGLFPIGTASNNRSINIYTSTAPTTGGIISVQYDENTAAGSTDFDDNSFAIKSFLPSAWSVTTAGLVSGTYNMNISTEGLNPINSLSDVRIMKSNGPAGTHGGISGTTTNATLTRTNLSQSDLNGAFRIGSNQVINPLPVELVSFKAEKTETQVNLTWQTATEKNNDLFQIERSANGRNFETIGQVKGAGNSSNLKAYSFADKNPVSGVSYYRLKQVDFDGKFEYSKIVSVTFEGKIAQASVLVYPNPASKVLNVKANGLNGKATLNITDLSGRSVKQIQVNAIETNSVNVENLPKGLYQIKVISEDGSTVTKFLKQ